MKHLFILLRPHQWLKNLFVLVGIIFAHAWQNIILVEQVVITVIAFCLLSSAMYIFNDIVDRETDRQHPLKKNRPLAAETVSLSHAVILAFAMSALGLLLGFIVSVTVAYILLAYIVLNIAYTQFFKQQVIMDVFVVSAGFLLRILAGTTGVGIAPSGWLLFCSFMLTLFLGFCKRQSELNLFAGQQITTPVNLQHYTTGLLDKLITITATSAIVSYTLYTLQQDDLLHAGEHRLIYTVPLVMFGIFRYLYLLGSKTQSGIDMARDLTRDLQLLGTVVVWFIAIILMELR